MRYVGLDVHKKVIEAAIIDEHGTVLERARCGADAFSIRKLVDELLQTTDQVALEATTNTWAVTRLLRPHIDRVIVSNPMATRAIAFAKIKTDKVDAETLAQLLRCGYLPEVWQPDDDTLAMRQLSSQRAWLTRDRTRHMNRVRSMLQMQLVEAPANLFSSKGLLELRKLLLDPLTRSQVDIELALIGAVNGELSKVEQEIVERSYGDPRIKLLMTIPGVDVNVAFAVMAAIGDVTRFTTAKKLASYFGLAPTTRQSASKTRHGKITKQGNSHSRWLLVEAAQHLARNSGPLGVFFRRLSEKKNRNVAIVATARKLATIAWHLLTKGEPYRYAKPQSTSQKLAKLRVGATGARKAGGAAKGAPRASSYGSGQRTRLIPSLDEVYASEGIPPLLPPPPGEQRTLARTGTAEYAREIRTTRRVARSPKLAATT